MLFSEACSLERSDEDDWYDPFLIADTRLFIDPFRIYADADDRWQPHIHGSLSSSILY
jgi:hypothetical protein